jgi:hypothetical protein
MPTSRFASSLLNPRTWLLCAAAVALAEGCNDSSGLNLKGDAGVDAKQGADAKSESDVGLACEQAGGSCVAVYPGACASGTVVGLACGPGVGTECCMPGGQGGSSGTGGSGAARGSGGASGTGGALSSGGASGTGGAPSSGGTSGTGGTRGSGGANGTGGTRGSGGANGTGGQPGTTCQQAGGSCVAVLPGACASGLVVDFSCGAGIGAECCMPGSRDGGIDSGHPNLAELCTATGGVVTTQLCCSSASDFPQTCNVGGCSCSPSSSKNISVCACATGCFNQTVGCTTK